MNEVAFTETFTSDRFIKERKEKDPKVEIATATKFAALPWRLGRQSVVNALKDSLDRLGLSSVELYQLHWYDPSSHSCQVVTRYPSRHRL